MSVKIKDTGSIAIQLTQMASWPREKQITAIAKMLASHLEEQDPNTDKRAAANEFRRRFDERVTGYPELKKAMGAVYSRFVEEHEKNKSA